MARKQVLYIRAKTRDLFPPDEPLVPALLRIMPVVNDLRTLQKVWFYIHSRDAITPSEQDIIKAEDNYLFRLTCALETLSFGKVQLVLFDNDEKPQSILGVGSDGPGLILGGKEGTTFLSDTLLLFSGKDFKVRLGMTLFPPQEPGLILAGSNGKHRAKLILGDDSAAALRFLDPDGKKVIWSAP